MTAHARHTVAAAAALAVAAGLVALASCARVANPHPADAQASTNGAISPQDQADALHFIIAADREIYCRILGPPQAGGAGPSPCEMLRRSAESIQSSGAEFSFALRSLHPADPRNAPQTELERQGLAFVDGHPAQGFYGREMLGGRRYVTAVYADLPATAACIACHDRRSASPDHRYSAGERMGGVVIRVPLEF